MKTIIFPDKYQKTYRKLYFSILFYANFHAVKGQHHWNSLKIKCFFRDFSMLKCIQKNFWIFFSKWRLYTMTAEETLNLPAPQLAGHDVILVDKIKRKHFLLIMNKSNKICSIFYKY